MRYHGRRVAREALEDSVWRLTYDVSFTSENDEAVVRLALPTEGGHVSVVDEKFIEPSLRGRSRRLKTSKTKERVVTAHQLGPFRLTAEVDIKLSANRTTGYRNLSNLSADARARYTRDESYLPIRSALVQQVLQSTGRDVEGDEELLQRIFEYCSTDLHPADPKRMGDSVLGTLKEKVATPLGRSRTMVTLCRSSGLPARMVAGFELRQHKDAEPHIWLEVFRGNHWAPFDPENGYARSMPSNFVAVRHDGEQIVLSRLSAPAADIKTVYSIVRLGPPEKALRSNRWSPWQVFDLTRLPIEMHKVLSLLLLLPLGALITALFRNVIGIPTFGTFAPALFAVSFIYSDWASGLVVLGVVLVAGFAGRMLVEQLHLLMVPRLSIILTTIILCVVFVVSGLDYLNLTPSAKAVLLPLVILTILIERFYVTTEEDGVGFAIQLVAGTLVVAACCYLLLRWEDVGRFILIYPEAHCLTIAAFIAIGRYTGYRLVELWRFRDLVDEEPVDERRGRAVGRESSDPC